MTRDEKLQMLMQWKERYIELDEKMDALHAVVGGAIDSPLDKAVWSAWGGYTSAVGALVGDEDDWLNWYCYECDMGRSPRSAGWDDDMRTIDNVDALLWVIEGVAAKPDGSA